MASKDPGVIGKDIRIKGVLRGSEDLAIHGSVEGTIVLKDNHLTLEREATIHAQIDARDVTIHGDITGNTEAFDKVEIKSGARVQGDIKAPRLVMEEGARFRGAVEMDVELPPGLLDDAPASTSKKSDSRKSDSKKSDDTGLLEY